MSKTFIKQLAEYVELHRDAKTGIAWINDGKTGCEESLHPSIDKSGSIKGMKKKGYWGKNDKIITCNNGHYNISKESQFSVYAKTLKKACKCSVCRDKFDRTQRI